MLNTFELSKSIHQYVVDVRRHLHENPELSMQEKKTMQFVCKELEELNIPFEIVPEGGIIGRIKGNKAGKTLILRADLDALPMQESHMNLSVEKNVVSKVDGVAHTCGHDAHTAILLGVSKLLVQQQSLIDGEVLLVFEQGEEIGGGITNLMERLIEIGADGVWGIHVKNDLATGKISVESGPRMSAPLPFEVTIKGRGGHGSRPDLAHSPIDCYVDFHTRLAAMQSQQTNPFQPVTFSVGSLQAGNAPNVIPDSLTFAGTFRFLQIEQGEKLAKHFSNLLENTCLSHHCSYEYIRKPIAKELFVYNNETCATIAEQAVTKAYGKESLQTLEPWMASEPFAMYQAFFPGVFAFLGIENKSKGTGADHHNLHFDIDEDALQLGVAATLQYTFDFLNYEKTIPFEQKYTSIKQLAL